MDCWLSQMARSGQAPKVLQGLGASVNYADMMLLLRWVCAEENADLGMVYGYPAIKHGATRHSIADLPAADVAPALADQRLPDQAPVDSMEQPVTRDEQKVQPHVGRVNFATPLSFQLCFLCVASALLELSQL